MFGSKIHNLGRKPGSIKEEPERPAPFVGILYGGWLSA
jgi:hypothetical protein